MMTLHKAIHGWVHFVSIKYLLFSYMKFNSFVAILSMRIVHVSVVYLCTSGIKWIVAKYILFYVGNAPTAYLHIQALRFLYIPKVHRKTPDFLKLGIHVRSSEIIFLNTRCTTQRSSADTCKKSFNFTDSFKAQFTGFVPSLAYKLFSYSFNCTNERNTCRIFSYQLTC